MNDNTTADRPSAAVYTLPPAMDAEDEFVHLWTQRARISARLDSLWATLTEGQPAALVAAAAWMMEHPDGLTLSSAGLRGRNLGSQGFLFKGLRDADSYA